MLIWPAFVFDLVSQVTVAFEDLVSRVLQDYQCSDDAYISLTPVNAVAEACSKRSVPTPSPCLADPQKEKLEFGIPDPCHVVRDYSQPSAFY